MPFPPPPTEEQYRAFNLHLMQYGGYLQNCIVARTPECRERGAFFIAPPPEIGPDGQPRYPASGGAHVCADCGAFLIREKRGGA